MMKYDILQKLKDHLYQTLSKNTARKYYSSAVKLFNGIQFSSIEEISEDLIKNASIKFKTRNEFSAAKNALKHMKLVYPELKLPAEEFFKGVSQRKRNWSKRPKKNIYIDTTKRKINQIRNEKLRYAYRLALISGLRVSELSALEKRDVAFLDGRIQINVRHGKGGSNGIVQCMEDPFLFHRLLEYVKDKADTDQLFYSSTYMGEVAHGLGIECHDLRRACAITYRNNLKREMPVAEANIKVQEMLRHRRFSTTKRYLFNKKLLVSEKKPGGGLKLEDDRKGTE